MVQKSKSAVHFGAGNIGRGFIGPLLAGSGYHVTFADVSEPVLDALNDRDQYTVHILDQHSHDEQMQNFSGINSADPALENYIASADIVTTSVGPEILKRIAQTVAQALSKRRQQSGTELTIIACENMIRGSTQFKELVQEHLTDKEDLQYLEDKIGFADCEVDRIVPPYTGDDALDVGVENFFEWIVEKKSIKGDLGIKGMSLKDHLEPFLERKLFTLNCGHAILAFQGHVRGYSTVINAIGDEDIKKLTRSALEESGAALIKRHGFDEMEHKKYINSTMVRYANPNMHDDVARVSRKPLRKLSPGERLVGPANLCKEYGLPADNLLKGIAAGFHFDVDGDDEAEELMKLIKEKGIAEAVAEVTKWEPGSNEHKQVLKDYEELGKIKSKI